MKNSILFLLLLVLLFPAICRAQMTVDCTGNNQGTYSSISSALSAAGFGSTIVVVAGPCTEDVYIAGAKNLFVGAVWGQRITLNGLMSVTQSQGVYLYGLDISVPYADGIALYESQGVVIDSCTSSHNGGAGLNLGGGSEALINGPAAFDFNLGGGITISGKSYVETGWAGPIDISNNASSGVLASPGTFFSWGGLTVTNNYPTGLPGAAGSGLDLSQNSAAMLGSCNGPIVVSGNQQGGVLMVETSQASIFSCGNDLLVANNGPFGVSVGFGSQVTLDAVEVSGNSGPAVDVYSNGQARLIGANNLHNNGNSADQRSAAVRVDGNSEVLLRGGQITHNAGPGILALVNSSADFTGVSFGSNTGGVIVCDTSAYMVSDATGRGVSCRTPHGLGNRRVTIQRHALPDWKAAKTIQAKYRALAKRK